MSDTVSTSPDMEPRKKRKVEPVPPPAPPTSAFALRKRLLQQKEEQARAAQAETAAASVDGAGEAEPPVEKQARTETPKTPKTRKAKKAKEALPAEPVAVAAVAPVEPPAPVETPAPAEKIAQLTTPPSRTGPVIIRSSFQPNRQNFQGKANGQLHLRIADDQRLVILGSYGLTVREGEVTLAGAILRASDKTHWVHAPRCHALPVLRCTDDAYVVLQPHPAAPALRELAKLSPIFQNIWNEPKPDADANSTFQIIYTSDDCQAVSRDLSSPAEWNKLIAELTSPKKTTSSTKGGQPVFFVCGPKSSGKSTFSRLLANRILTADAADGKKTRKWALPSLAVLDIDPGQPEYGTPGSLSLVHVHEANLSPTFCHPYVNGSANSNILLRAHETATVSPSTDPEHYIECVTDLFSLYRRDLRSRCPLVVNTPGWIQGTGLEILKSLAARMQATKVIYMSQEGPEDTVQGLRSAYPSVPLVELPSQPGDLRVRTAAHLRSMQTMSYFHLNLDGNAAPSPPSKKTKTTVSKQYLSWHASPLTTVRPWIVPYSGSESGILGVTCYDSQPPPNLIAATINGTIVSIVAIQNASAFRTTQRREARNYDSPMDIDEDEDEAAEALGKSANDRLPPIVRSPEGIPFILNPSEAKLDPRYSHKLGVALVRGIDHVNRVLHLLTPLPVDDLLEEVIRQDGMGLVLVSGKFDVPTWAYTEDTNLQNYKTENEDEKGDGSAINEGEETDNDGDEEGADTVTGDSTKINAEPEAEAEAEAEAKAAPGDMLPTPSSKIPWVQVLQGRQTRDAGSQVWRVRRDLGRNTAGGGD